MVESGMLIYAKIRWTSYWLISEMKLSEFQLTVLRKSSETQGHGGYAAASCNRHLERAWKIKDYMPEVSVFLAITAEEEAATSLFHALKKRNYDNSNRIKLRDHRFKAGVYPFLKLIGETLIPPKDTLSLNLYFDSGFHPNGEEVLRIRMPIFIKGGREYFLIPEPPLNFISKDSGGENKNYLKEVRDAATEKGIESIYRYIRKLANERNKMLYASDSGVPHIEDASPALQRHTNAAILNLMIYLLIEPHERQNLPQEALNAYINILDRIEDKG